MPMFKKKPKGLGRGELKNRKHGVCSKKSIRKEITIREAADRYKVPKSTLQRKIAKLDNGLEVAKQQELGTFKPTFCESVSGDAYGKLR